MCLQKADWRVSYCTNGLGSLWCTIIKLGFYKRYQTILYNCIVIIFSAFEYFFWEWQSLFSVGGGEGETKIYSYGSQSFGRAVICTCGQEPGTLHKADQLQNSQIQAKICRIAERKVILKEAWFILYVL